MVEGYKPTVAGYFYFLGTVEKAPYLSIAEADKGSTWRYQTACKDVEECSGLRNQRERTA